MRQLSKWGPFCFLLQVGACDERAAPAPVATGQASSIARVGESLGPPIERAAPRVGMVHIQPGALVVGTPPDRRPRRADRELPGEQVMLAGFYIDRFAFPNEEGAIPVTNVTHTEADALCREKNKRLCTELEWERACKGPDNRTYEYGDTYRSEACRTGQAAQLRPSGFFVGCQSDFGVRDMHGGVFEWTADFYRRGYEKGEIAIRGGNSKEGEVSGRCANVESSLPQSRSGTVGFRCCSGPKNDAEVQLRINHRAGLIPRVRFAAEIEKSLIAALPEEVKNTLKVAGKIKRQRVWLWRPVANEEIHLLALCGRGKPPPFRPRCGLLLARVVPGNVQALAWVSSSEWVANLHRPGPHEMLYLIGGDRRGSFKRLITYEYGDIQVGKLTLGAPNVKKKKKKKK